MDANDSHPQDITLWGDWNFDGDNNGMDADEDNHNDATDDSHPHNPELWWDYNNDGDNGGEFDKDEDGYSTLQNSDSDDHNPLLYDDWNYNGISDVQDSINADYDQDGTLNEDDTDPEDPDLWEDHNRNGYNDTGEEHYVDSDGDGHNDAYDSHPGNILLWDDWNNDGFSDWDQDWPNRDDDTDGTNNGVDTHPDNGSLWSDYDNDGLNAEYEVQFGTDPEVSDTDDDGLDDGAEAYLGTNPAHVDSDGDFLTDYEEVMVHGSSPTNQYSLSIGAGWGSIYTDWQMLPHTDTDEDGIPDRIEAAYGMNINGAADAGGDLDGDDITNLQEYQNGTDFAGGLALRDHDRDGMSDVLETFWNLKYSSMFDIYNPADAVRDMDGDGLLDYEELRFGTDPGDPDTSTTQVEENWTGGLGSHSPDFQAVMTANASDPVISSWLPAIGDGDADGDGLPDAWEHTYRKRFNLPGLDLRDPSDELDDPDEDNISNFLEFWLDANPLLPDSDGDGVTDGDEDYDNDGLTNAEEEAAGTKLNDADSDDDGLSDSQEVALGTNPLSADSDGDGVSDSQEVEEGSDPMNAASNSTALIGLRFLVTPGFTR